MTFGVNHDVLNLKPRNILVVVAHRDDEVLGLGGTIAKHVNKGDVIYVVSMTDGVGAREVDVGLEIELRKKASVSAGKILGLNWVEVQSFPDNAMDTVPLLDVIKVIEKVKFTLNPSLIYTHSASDLNIDHRIVSQAVLTAFRPQPNENWEEIRIFETPSVTDFSHKSIAGYFHPNLYVDITRTWDKKISALKSYSLEMREAPHSRSFMGVENLAKYRGNQAGVEFAEAFEIVRRIERDD